MNFCHDENSARLTWKDFVRDGLHSDKIKKTVFHSTVVVDDKPTFLFVLSYIDVFTSHHETQPVLYDGERYALCRIYFDEVHVADDDYSIRLNSMSDKVRRCFDEIVGGL